MIGEHGAESARPETCPPFRVRVYAFPAALLRELAGEPHNEPGVRLNPTGDGKGIIFIGHDEEVFPSGLLPVSLGNVKTSTLKQIYTSHPLLVGLRDTANLKGRCGGCECRTICSGSRSRAWAEFHDPYQEDPACVHAVE